LQHIQPHFRQKGLVTKEYKTYASELLIKNISTYKLELDFFSRYIKMAKFIFSTPVCFSLQ